jgi:hypothetical protein
LDLYVLEAEEVVDGSGESRHALLRGDHGVVSLDATFFEVARLVFGRGIEVLDYDTA